MATHPFPWREPLLEALRHMPVLQHACNAVGINRSTLHRARKADPELDAAIEEALEAGIDRAEQAAFQRGVDGWEEPVIAQGRVIWRTERYVDEDGVESFRQVLDAHGQPVPYTVRKYSDTMLSLILKGRRKKVFADRTELTGADGAPIETNDTARAARVAHLLALAQARKDAEDLA